MQRSLELTVPGYPQNGNLRDTHHGWLDLLRHGVAGRLDFSYRLSQGYRSARAVEIDIVRLLSTTSPVAKLGAVTKYKMAASMTGLSLPWS
jgi:hypothetical protein